MLTSAEAETFLIRELEQFFLEIQSLEEQKGDIITQSRKEWATCLADFLLALEK